MLSDVPGSLSGEICVFLLILWTTKETAADQKIATAIHHAALISTSVTKLSSLSRGVLVGVGVHCRRQSEGLLADGGGRVIAGIGWLHHSLGRHVDSGSRHRDWMLLCEER